MFLSILTGFQRSSCKPPDKRWVCTEKIIKMLGAREVYAVQLRAHSAQFIAVSHFCRSLLLCVTSHNLDYKSPIVSEQVEVGGRPETAVVAANVIEYVD